MTCSNCDCENCPDNCACENCSPETCECKNKKPQPQDDFGYHNPHAMKRMNGSLSSVSSHTLHEYLRQFRL
jgi:hypothetical protein